MNKLFSMIIMTLLCFTTGFSAYAEDEIAVQLNGTPVQFSDQGAVLCSGHALVPARGLFEQMGAHVKWDPDKMTVQITTITKTLLLQIGNQYMLIVDNAEYGSDTSGAYVPAMIALDTSAKLLNGRTMVPLRAISEGLGAVVDWNEEASSVHITYTAPNIVR